MFLQTLILTVLLNTPVINIQNLETEPLQELIEKRAYLLQTKLEPLDSSQISISTINVSKNLNVNPFLILAVIEIESRYDKKAKSKKKCRGLTQVSQKTGKNIATKLGLTQYNLDDIKDNILIGVSFLKEILQSHPRLLTALTIYNRGLGNFKKNPKISNYAHAVVKRFRYLKSIYKTNIFCTK
jgi:soluble lytic murein transglycosylase-like protein